MSKDIVRGLSLFRDPEEHFNKNHSSRRAVRKVVKHLIFWENNFPRGATNHLPTMGLMIKSL